MGKKRRAPTEWLAIYPDLIIIKKKRIERNSMPSKTITTVIDCETDIQIAEVSVVGESVVSQERDEEVIACKYCRTEFDLTRKPSDRIKEHMSCKSHEKMKNKSTSGGPLQPTLMDIEVRRKAKHSKFEGATYDFIRALCYDGIPLVKSDGFLGEYARKYCPSARKLPHSDELVKKHLKEVFESHKNSIISRIMDKNLTVIMDESPDIFSRPAVNTLFAFYDNNTKSKAVLLVDCNIEKRCNSVSMAVLLNRVLSDYGVHWKNIIGIASDSAEYMNKMFSDLCISENNRMIHINDSAHLLHIIVDNAFKIESFKEIVNILDKLGKLFKNSNKIRDIFFDICDDNNSPQKIPKVFITSRWFSILRTANDVQELWPCLILLLNRKDLQKNKKVQKLLNLFGDSEHQKIIFAKVIFITDVLKPLEIMQKCFETGNVVSHQMYNIINVKLISYLENNCKNYENISDKAKVLVSTLSHENSKLVKESFKNFCDAMISKWNDTKSRNLSNNVFGDDGIFHKCMILNPYEKRLQNQTYFEYQNMFNIVHDFDLSEESNTQLENEFNDYLTEEIPQNKNIPILDYWISVEHKYPLLSGYAKDLLCIPSGSIDAERSFSMFRNIQTDRRSMISNIHLNMYSILYFNGDIEGYFHNK